MATIKAGDFPPEADQPLAGNLDGVVDGND